MVRQRVAINGMSCGSCIRRIKRSLASVSGIEVADVRIGSADITFDPAVSDWAVVRAAIERAGYSVRDDSQGSLELSLLHNACCSAAPVPK